MDHNLPSTKILGVNITVTPKLEVLEYILKRLKKPEKKFYIVTPNPEMLVLASRSSGFRDILNGAAVALPDGVGVVLAGSMLKKERFNRITGTDILDDLCRECAKDGLSVGFLGGRDGVAEKVSERLRKKYPELIVSFVGEEWPSSSNAISTGPVVAPPPSDNPRFTAGARRGSPSASHPRSRIDILFVAFGFPKQEEWIARNLENLPVTACMGVGGAFDYISGKVPRAPKVLRGAGLEWAFRLAVQPWRLKRQLALPIFAIKVLKEKYQL